MLVQAYSFTSAPIAAALVQAAKRGTDVALVVDKSQANARYSQVPSLLDASIPVYIDYHPAIAHNTENMLIIEDTGLAKQVYRQYQFTHRAIGTGQTQYCRLMSIKIA